MVVVVGDKEVYGSGEKAAVYGTPAGGNLLSGKGASFVYELHL